MSELFCPSHHFLVLLGQKSDDQDKIIQDIFKAYLPGENN